MPYMIDGHNLIPHVPGLSLQDMDDEMQLIELLQEFSRLQKKDVEVFFDNAPAGQPRARTFGVVTARFARQGTTADAAIRSRLERLGKEARNWTVVSSDQAVQASARAARAHYISSEMFVRLMGQAMEQNGKDKGALPDAAVPPGEVDEWLELFGGTESE